MTDLKRRYADHLDKASERELLIMLNTKVIEVVK